MNRLLKLSLDPDLKSPTAVFGHLILRASIGVVIFYIHGLHKLEGGLAYLQHGTPWTRAKQVAEMHFPAPVVSTFAATALTDANGAVDQPERLAPLIQQIQQQPQTVVRTINWRSDAASAENEKLQEGKFATVAIPHYALVDGDEKIIASFAGSTKDTNVFLKFLQSGKSASL